MLYESDIPGTKKCNCNKDAENSWKVRLTAKITVTVVFPPLFTSSASKSAISKQSCLMIRLTHVS